MGRLPFFPFETIFFFHETAFIALIRPGHVFRRSSPRAPEKLFAVESFLLPFRWKTGFFLCHSNYRSFFSFRFLRRPPHLFHPFLRSWSLSSSRFPLRPFAKDFPGPHFARHFSICARHFFWFPNFLLEQKHHSILRSFGSSPSFRPERPSRTPI